MTDHAKRIAQSKASLAKAQAKHQGAKAKREAALRAASTKHVPAIYKALKVVYAKRADLSRAELAAQGIVEMHTIFRISGNLWAARIAANGHIRLVPATNAGSIHQGRNEAYEPWGWSGVTIISKTMQKDAK